MKPLLARLRVWFRPPRRLRPTRDGWWFLGATVGVGFAAVNTGNNLLFFIVGLLLATLVISGVLSEWAIRDLRIRRDVPPGFRAGAEGRYRFVVENRKKVLASLALELRELHVPKATVARLPPCPAGGRVSGSVTWEPPRRGLLVLSVVEVATTWPFGLFRKSREIDLPDEVLVWPRRVPAQDLAPDGSGDRGEAPRDRRGEGFELFGLRDYVPGEDARKIAWKATARLGRPVAQERSAEDSQVILIRVDATGTPEAFESDIEAAAALAERFLEDGHPVGVVAGSQAVAPVAGPGALRTILDALALASQASADAPPHHAGTRVVVARAAPGAGEGTWQRAS